MSFSRAGERGEMRYSGDRDDPRWDDDNYTPPGYERVTGYVRNYGGLEQWQPPGTRRIKGYTYLQNALRKIDVNNKTVYQNPQPDRADVFNLKDGDLPLDRDREKLQSVASSASYAAPTMRTKEAAEGAPTLFSKKNMIIGGVVAAIAAVVVVAIVLVVRHKKTLHLR